MNLSTDADLQRVLNILENSEDDFSSDDEYRDAAWKPSHSLLNSAHSDDSSSEDEVEDGNRLFLGIFRI